MNAIARKPILAADPQHLHLAAVAMAFAVRSGALSYSDAAAALALGAIQDGVLDRMDDQEFLALRGRLESSLIKATVDIDRPAADAIRRGIASSIANRHPKRLTLLIAKAVNGSFGWTFRNQYPERAMLTPLPDQAVEEICRQEVKRAVQAMRVSDAR